MLIQYTLLNYSRPSRAEGPNESWIMDFNNYGQNGDGTLRTTVPDLSICCVKNPW